MTVQGGFGLVCQIDVSGTPTTFALIRNLDMPAFMNFIAESTTHDAPQGYYTATSSGKKRVEPFSLDLTWDVSQASHAAVITAFDSGDAVTFSVADPDGDETIAIEVIVERMKRSSVQEGMLECTVDLHPSGPPTIT